MLEDIRLGQIALRMDFLDEDDLEEVLKEQERLEAAGRYRPIGQVMVQRGFITRSQLRRLLRQQRSLAARVTRINGYKLLSLRAEGGMGALYRAYDMERGVTVALKVLPRSHARRKNLLERFRREALSGAILDHPNIVKVIDADYADGYHYIAMEYVEGMSVAEMLSEMGRLKEKDALSIVIQIARALEHIAERGLVHRDIKPGNILVDGEGVAKLADMGLALWVERPLPRLTLTGRTMGTPLYVAPEQAQGGAVDIRSDIYALGATLYEMITGVPPFRGRSAADILSKHVLKEPQHPQEIERTLSDGVCYVVRKMMRKDPAERYQSPKELMKDLMVVYMGEEPEALKKRSRPRPERIPGLIQEEALPGEVLPRERPTPVRSYQKTRLSTGRLYPARRPPQELWSSVWVRMALAGVLMLGAGVLLGHALSSGPRPAAAGMAPAGSVTLDLSSPVPGWKGGGFVEGGLQASGSPPVLQMYSTGLDLGEGAVFSLDVFSEDGGVMFVSVQKESGGVYSAAFRLGGGEERVSVSAGEFRSLGTGRKGLPAGKYVRLTVELSGEGSFILQRLTVRPALLFLCEPD